MPNWHASVNGPILHLVHDRPDDELDVTGAWDIEIHRGAPSWASHPELQHAALGIMNEVVHRPFILHSWTFDVPDRWGGRENFGARREFMTLQATGGSMNWSLVLRFPPHAPQAVWAAVARGFHAQLETGRQASAARDIQQGPHAVRARLESVERERGETSGGVALLGSGADSAPGESSDPSPWSRAAADESDAARPSGSDLHAKAPGQGDDQGALPSGISSPPATRRLSRAQHAAL